MGQEMCPEYPCMYIGTSLSVLWAISTQSINMYWNELNIICLREDIEGIVLFCYFKNSCEMWLLLTYVVCNALQGSFSVLFYQSFKNGSFLLQLDLWLILAGEGGPAGNYGNYGYANSGYSACEEENDRLTESLRHKVTAIKSVSI